ncbi:hypothetical protein FA95DRAFT_1607656 [Auriscalpium vulgare]|uniref:Uncharacterized protein n=1 Tax=Auriscalpium vulgare TaxID=40419 RepID=A0ACB8RNH6_9AGAM|nr:hypothetical protein FA95DRAFT_1607656 [Auriscalpium vulgare]
MDDRRKKKDYMRHRDKRLEYQQFYNSIKRASRRKVSKAQRLHTEHARKVARHYHLPPPYRSKIASILKDEDSQRTPQMRRLEDEVWRDWTALREDLMATLKDNWMPRYIEEVHAAINEQLGHVQTLRDSGLASEKKIHAHRRFIAGLHQEIEIIQCGLDVYEASVFADVFIFGGRSVRKAYFRQVYGF